MTPGLVHFVCPQGTTFQRTLTYTLDEAPINLSGYSARLQVRQAHYSTDPLVSLVSGSGISISGSAGIIDIEISSSDTSDMVAGTHVYDLEIESPSGVINRLIEGNFTVTPEVTR
jgi:hypothetical protein